MHNTVKIQIVHFLDWYKIIFILEIIVNMTRLYTVSSL